MAKKGQDWEKIADDKGLPEVKKIEGKMSTQWGTGTVVIPGPREVNEMMKTQHHQGLFRFTGQATQKELPSMMVERWSNSSYTLKETKGSNLVQGTGLVGPQILNTISSDTQFSL